MTTSNYLHKSRKKTFYTKFHFEVWSSIFLWLNPLHHSMFNVLSTNAIQTKLNANNVAGDGVNQSIESSCQNYIYQDNWDCAAFSNLCKQTSNYQLLLYWSYKNSIIWNNLFLYYRIGKRNAWCMRVCVWDWWRPNSINQYQLHYRCATRAH